VRFHVDVPKRSLGRKGSENARTAKVRGHQKIADALTDKSKGIYGITLRGKPGWGENMALSHADQHFAVLV